MDEQAKIKVIGVGDAGNNIVNRMIEAKVKHVSYFEVNTDINVLKNSNTKNTIQIGKQTTEGLGCGTDATLGEKSAIEDKDEIKNILQDTDMVFLTAGMGGGTGTGGLPVIAKLAKEMGVLTIAIVTKPFSFEGKKRKLRAELGINELRRNVDALIIVLNDNLLEIVGSKTTIKTAFKIADNVLKRGIQSITDLITNVGEINIDYADVKTIMSYQGGAYMGVGESSGRRAIKDAVKQAMENRLTQIRIDGAKGVIINIEGNEDLGLTEINESLQMVNDKVSPEANIIFGTTIKKELEDTVKVTIIATGIDEEEQRKVENTIQ